ncbi:O-antigen ligase family protein [Pelobium manganitolerans]|uniref:O-antigen ligase family protein n=1 Tax=Pelobium manganitolerans TaxID=1842495 RepID=UPI0016024912|nr:O-antigen ligase family protein [Pelobium manganitolerans]
MLVDFDAFVSAVEASKNVEPVIGSHHSNLNLLYVIAFGFGLVTAEKENRPWARLLLLILLGLMFFQLHLIAFRFSVIAVYIFLALYLIRWLLISNRKSVWLALFMVLFFAVVFSFVPSINARYQNTVQDLKVFKQNKNPNFNSLTQRILALDCAYKIILRHPLYGVSPTIAEQRMQEQYALNSYLLIPENRVFVHNQFAYFLLCFGVLGGAVLALVILWLIFKQFTTKGYGWILLPFVLHMLIENTLEKQITLAAFIFLVLIIQKHQQTINATN